VIQIVVVPIAIAVLALVGPSLQYRLQARAHARAERAQDTERGAQGADVVFRGFASLVDEAQEERSDLRERVRALEDAAQAQGEKITLLETGRADDRRRISAAVRYIRALRHLLVERGETPPPVPEELSDDLADHPAEPAT
jgi:hypothetical protein